MLIHLYHMKVFDKMEEFVPILRCSALFSSVPTFYIILLMSREKFFWDFPSFDKYSSHDPEGSNDIEMFLWSRAKILKYPTKIMLEKVYFKDIR